MNKVFLIGNLTKDVELRTTSSGLSTASFTLAVQRRFKDKDGNRASDFIPVVAWRQTADLCGRYLKKGSKCCVVGTIQTRSYDGRDGQKRYVTEVVADEVEFLSSRNDAAQKGNSGADGDDFADLPKDGFTEVDDDQMPF